MPLLLPARPIPVHARYDVAVVGGGIAGVAAAVAAARNGARACLIEKMQVLGGLATAGNIVVYLPLCDGFGNQISFGLAEEMIHLPLRHSAATLPPAWTRKEDSTQEARAESRFELVYDPGPMMVALENLLLDEQVDVILDTRVTEAMADTTGLITHLVAWNASGAGAFEVGAVVDASGDATIAASVGEQVETCVSKHPACWHYSVNARREIALRCKTHAADEQGAYGTAYDPTRYRDVSRFLLDSHRRALEAAESLGPEDHLFALPAMHNFTKTRRLRGAYTLTEADVGRHFEDSIGAVADWRRTGRSIEIPRRTLHGTTPNLFVAGRCISSAGDAWEMTRVIPGCAVTGEAAGKAAAEAATRKVNATHGEKT